MSGSKLPSPAPTLRPPPPVAPVGTIISATFSTSGFTKRWSHCHQLANYFARYASANEGDPERHSTLLSTFFNELLEALYHNRVPDGQVKLEFSHAYDVIVVRAYFPADDQVKRFFQNAVRIANLPDPMSWYREQLESEESGEEASCLGLIDLVVVYGSRFIMEEGENGTLCFSIEFPWHEAEEI